MARWTIKQAVAARSVTISNTEPNRVSGLLDAVDGHAARFYNQSTRFGSVLDMVTDRAATACLIVHLAILYPSFLFCFQILIALDFSSHYMQMYASLTAGLSSHKSMSASAPWLMRMYYTNRIILFLVCMGNELFFVGLYLLSWSNATWIMLVTLIASPVFVFKQVLNVIQLIQASQSLSIADLETRRKGKGRHDS